MQSPFLERLFFVVLIPCICCSFIFITAQPKNPLGYILTVLSIGAEYVLWKRDKNRNKKTPYS